MKKITFLFFAVCLLSSLTAFGQFSFPADAGPHSVVNGSPVTLNINDLANTAAVPTTGTYSSFSVSVDWVDTNNSYSSEADLTMNTTGSSVSIDPATTGSASNGNATTMTFDGDFDVVYDPSVDGTLDIILNQSWSGSSADWSNIVVTIFPTPTCPDPSGLSATVSTGTSAELSWTVGGTESLWDIEVVDITGGGSATGTPTASGVSNPYTAMGLTEGNDYEFYVRADCTGGDLSTWAGPYSWSQIVPPANDECTNATALVCGTPLTGQTTVAASGGSASSCVGSIGDDVWYVFTGNDNTVNLSLNASVQEGQIGVYESTDGTCAGFTLGTCIASGGSGENPVDVSFDADLGTTYYIRVGNWINGDPGVEFELSATCTPYPTCLEPTALSASVTSSTEASLGWTAGDTESLWDVEVVDITGGGSATGTPTASGVSNPYTVMGLTEGNDYEFYVRADCTGGDLSTWAGPYSWSQIVPPANDECSAAIGLTVNADYACGVVTNGTVAGATDSGADDATCFGTPDDDVWYSFVATAAEHRVSLINITGSTSDMYMAFYDGTAGCGSLGGSVFCSDPQTANLTGLTIGTTYYVQVYTYTSTADQTSVFDICVGTAPSCDVPTDLAAVTNITTADLSWTAPTIGTPVGYNWEIQPDGVAQGTAGAIDSGSTATTMATTTSLVAETIYDLYVQTDCGGGDLSAWAGPYKFSTGYCIPNSTSTATYVENFSTTNGGVNVSNLTSGYTTGGYIDNSSAMSVSQAPDGTFDFNVEIVGGTVGCAIWVDWNNDYNFDVSEATFSTTAYGNGPFTGTVTIPTGAADGDYRMRVMIDWNDSNPGDDEPCSYGSTTTPRGETEDYTVTVDASLSTNEVSFHGFKYFPNPVEGILSLRAQQNMENVAVYNMLGQEVINISPNAMSNDLDMSALSRGAYFVRVSINGAVENFKIIKE